MVKALSTIPAAAHSVESAPPKRRPGGVTCGYRAELRVLPDEQVPRPAVGLESPLWGWFLPVQLAALTEREPHKVGKAGQCGDEGDDEDRVDTRTSPETQNTHRLPPVTCLCLRRWPELLTGYPRGS